MLPEQEDQMMRPADEVFEDHLRLRSLGDLDQKQALPKG